MSIRLLRLSFVVAVAFLLYAAWQRLPARYPEWSDAERASLSSLSLRALPELPPDPSNAVADHPLAAEFGERLFADPRMSANGMIACSTCHQPIRRFTDGLQKGQALGTVARNTPSIVGTAYSPWQFWDGRSDSQWAQALAPLEDVNEHGSSREQVAALIVEDTDYRARYEALFGHSPQVEGVDTVFANVGKAIAAFERTLLPTPSRFDDFVDAVLSGDRARQEVLFTADEAQGLRLFIGSANCTQCHNGPLLTNHEFHNTGVLSFPGEVPDKGRSAGVREVLQSEFNCSSSHSDDTARRCDELDFVRTGVELIGAFKTPSLRNLENTQPYMHKGQLPTLTAVLEHYNKAPDAMIGHNEAKPLGLSRRELGQLEAFLHSLASPASNEL